MKAAQILAISLQQPERLFTDPADLKAQYHALIKTWHPDKSSDPKASDVFAKIKELYNSAIQKVADGTWAPPGQIIFKGGDGVSRRLRFDLHHEFELGDTYYGRRAVAYRVKKDFARLFSGAVGTIRGLKYSGPDMEKEFSRYFPEIQASFDVVGGDCVLAIKKTDDVFMLGDVVKALGGKMEAKHVAWIGSRLFNIACYFEHANVMHNALSLDTIFVSPKHHSIMIYGGWWYAAKAGMVMTHLPARTHRLVSASMIKGKLANHAIDRTLIKATLRECLGDITGMMLTSADGPDPFIQFLKSPSLPTAVEDFTAWRKVLETSWGARRFVPLEIKESDIYQS